LICALQSLLPYAYIVQYAILGIHHVIELGDKNSDCITTDFDVTYERDTLTRIIDARRSRFGQWSSTDHQIASITARFYVAVTSIARTRTYHLADVTRA